jgi:predicted ATPase
VVSAFEGGARLVTLTGPGGIGKSRLAAAAAEVLDPRNPEGVLFVDLSSETDPERVPAAIAERIGVPTDPNSPPLEALIDHLGQFDMVIVLDGFERVADGAPHIATILSRCPNLAFLVTSRAALRLGAEHELRVEPLGWGREGAGYKETAEAPAVRLFVDRVRTVRPDFELTPENAPAIRELVERLDGSPLSIELAAARGRLLPPAAILERLGAVLDLSSASADLPTRQRSLRATIEWSHGLLSGPESRGCSDGSGCSSTVGRSRRPRPSPGRTHPTCSSGSRPWSRRA